jgi:hypothetical protein
MTTTTQPRPEVELGQGRTPADAAQQPMVAAAEWTIDVAVAWLRLLRKLSRVKGRTV